jgi:hypothetical protein
MDSLIKEFKLAYAAERGNDVAKTLTPDLLESPGKLLAIWESGGPQSIKDDLKFLFTRDKSTKLSMSHDEGEGWRNIYFAYWNALGEILAVEGRRRDDVKVGAF